MSEEESDDKKGLIQGLSKNTKITVGSSIAVIAVVVGFVINDTTLKVNTARDINDLREKMESLKSEVQENDVKKIHFQRWLFELQKNNPDIKVPNLNQ